MARFKLNKKGFSLIELLIVIAIIGIIATIAIPILLSARVGAVNEKARNSLRSLVSACAAYYAAKGTYPPTQADLYGATVADQYADSKLAAGDLGNVTVTYTQVSNEEYTATAVASTGTAPYKTYNADQTGLITEV